jgi:hypothetical protein
MPRHAKLITKLINESPHPHSVDPSLWRDETSPDFNDNPHNLDGEISALL